MKGHSAKRAILMICDLRLETMLPIPFHIDSSVSLLAMVHCQQTTHSTLIRLQSWVMDTAFSYYGRKLIGIVQTSLRGREQFVFLLRLSAFILYLLWYTFNTETDEHLGYLSLFTKLHISFLVIYFFTKLHASFSVTLFISV